MEGVNKSSGFLHPWKFLLKTVIFVTKFGNYLSTKVATFGNYCRQQWSFFI